MAEYIVVISCIHAWKELRIQYCPVRRLGEQPEDTSRWHHGNLNVLMIIMHAYTHPTKETSDLSNSES